MGASICFVGVCWIWADISHPLSIFGSAVSQVLLGTGPMERSSHFFLKVLTLVWLHIFSSNSSTLKRFCMHQDIMSLFKIHLNYDHRNIYGTKLEIWSMSFYRDTVFHTYIYGQLLKNNTMLHIIISYLCITSLIQFQICSEIFSELLRISE